MLCSFDKACITIKVKPKMRICRTDICIMYLVDNFCQAVKVLPSLISRKKGKYESVIVGNLMTLRELGHNLFWESFKLCPKLCKLETVVILVQFKDPVRFVYFFVVDACRACCHHQELLCATTLEI